MEYEYIPCPDKSSPMCSSHGMLDREQGLGINIPYPGARGAEGQQLFTNYSIISLHGVSRRTSGPMLCSQSRSPSSHGFCRSAPHRGAKHQLEFEAGGISQPDCPEQFQGTANAGTCQSCSWFADYLFAY